MAGQGYSETVVLKAGGDYSALRYYAMRQSGAYAIRQLTSGAYVFGVLQNKPNASGTAAVIRRFGNGGVHKVVAGAALTIAEHSYVKCDDSGKFIAQTYSDLQVLSTISGSVPRFLCGRPSEVGDGDGSVVKIYVDQFPVLQG